MTNYFLNSKFKIIFPIVILVSFTFIFSIIPVIAQNQSDDNGIIEEGKGNISIGAPTTESFLASPSPDILSDETIDILESRTEKTLIKPPIPRVNDTITPPPNGSAIESNKDAAAAAQQNSTRLVGFLPSEQYTDNLNFYVNTTVTASPSRSVVGEPSVSNNGPNIFYTGNWYAARSINNGSTWTYIAPLENMPDFCCDQDVIYDQSREIFIWYRQGTDIRENPADPASDLTQRVIISISTDAENWWSYSISPTDLNPALTNQWFDYPHLALSNNYIYFTTNVFNKFDQFTQSIIVRIPLDDIANGVNPTINYYASNQVFTFTPVQGASDTMYWAAHQDNSHMAIYNWTESSSATHVKKNVIEISSWNLKPPFIFKCATDEGLNWCKRSDSRITNGWITGNKIGFFWNVQQGGPFPFPYVEAAVFDSKNMSYVDRPLLWSKDYAIEYAYASPSNIDKYLGVIAVIGGGVINPTIVSAINGKNGNFEPWDLVPIVNGTHGPVEEKWGDYKRVRSYDNSTNTWIASGYTLQGGFTRDYTEPRLFIFGLDDNQNLLSPIQHISLNSLVKSVSYNNHDEKENRIK
jgi:hypothetical protein